MVHFPAYSSSFQYLHISAMIHYVNQTVHVSLAFSREFLCQNERGASRSHPCIFCSLASHSVQRVGFLSAALLLHRKISVSVIVLAI